MGTISTYAKLEEFGRIRLSRNFFMRDFLHSEIAAWHGLRNVPDHPEQAVAVGKLLCENLLEPLQSTFGRIHIRSGYRSPLVNKFGNENKLNCASNEANYARHIWDYRDANGGRGATACIVMPWLVDYIAGGGSWTAMAWWVHDHLPYSSLCFFPALAAFNISWHENPVRRIDSYAPPKGCLTQPGMPNHQGTHASEYQDFAALLKTASQATVVAAPRAIPMPNDNRVAAPGIDSRVKPAPRSPRPAAEVAPSTPKASPKTTTPDTLQFTSRTGGPIAYRAIHTRNLWRKVGSHTSLQNAILGKDGAAGLFAHKVRINYEQQGDPLYVLVWEGGAGTGYVVKADAAAPGGIRIASVPMKDLLDFEARGQASQRELERYFAG